MLVFIHSKFKIDLTYLQVTFNDENQWFKDDFSTEITFPFEFYLDSELSKNSGFEDHYNTINNIRVFDGKLDKDGVLVDAVLKFESVTGKKISATINAGNSNFPSFDKKLSELPLEKKIIGSLAEEAVSTIVKGYPESNYNFPMVHTDKYNSEADFNGFEKTINKFVGGSFVENVLDAELNVDLIKNIMQPLPYQMHVLKVGIEAAGYTLEGDILNDSDFKESLLFRDGSYFTVNTKTEIQIVYNNNQYDSLPFVNNTFQYVTFSKEVTVEKKGDYLLFGSIYSLVYSARKNPAWSHDRYRCSSLDLKIEKISSGISTMIFDVNFDREDGGTSNLWAEVRDDALDVEVSFNAGDIIKITKTEPKRDQVPSVTPEYPEAISFSLTPLRYRNPDGSPIMSVLPLKEIDLTRVVPDISFRDFVISIKNWGNYGFIPDGKVIRMDLIGTQLDRSKAVDLSSFDIPEPKRTFHDERTYELAFTDGSSNEKYKFDSVLITKDSNIINNYVVKDGVSSIKIDALPLPIITRNAIKTAYNFQDEPSKVRVVHMKKTAIGGSPVCYENLNVLLPFVASTKFKNWINFRINSIGWEWDFLISVEKFNEITLQTLIYAYSNYHVFSEVQKERVSKYWWRISAKTESLV
ncbi:hypothetical protein [Flavobacterium sp. T12S277]|uniref:hypothetical protein n=1 Tax=Flavobacterium sp. T12S277 TaxID=3402752 RepID=UPI003ADC0E32